MKRVTAGAMCAALVLAGAAIAGDKKAGQEAKCTYTTQECLDYMANQMKNSGWVGVQLERKEEGFGPMTITAVVPDSPAEAAGIHVGDVLTAMNSIPLADQEKIKTAREGWKPGTSVVWTMRRGEEKREVSIQLATMPADVLARYVGMHMLEHATAVDVASK